jgi:hypothetical protein
VSVADVTCVRTFCRIRLEMPSDSDLDWRAIDLALRPVAAGEAIFQTESHGEQNIGFLYFSDGKSHLPQRLGLLVRNEHHVHVAGELQPSGEELNTLFAGGDERTTHSPKSNCAYSPGSPSKRTTGSSRGLGRSFFTSAAVWLRPP